MMMEESLLRRALRWGLETKLSQKARHTLMSRDARFEQNFLLNQASFGQERTFVTESLVDVFGPKLSSDAFFILGSGSSIEDLSEVNFREISRNRSVGINNWGLHPFVPDIYSFESMPLVGDGRDFPRALALLNRKDIILKHPALLVLRPKTKLEIAHLAQVPATLRNNLFFYGRISPATRDTKNLLGDVACFFRHIAPRYPGVVLDSGASIVRMMSVGILLGFRHFVFAGVDLNHTEYFWERNSSYLLARGLPGLANNQAGPHHETLVPRNRPFSVVDMVTAVAKFVEVGLGGTVSVVSQKSALAEFLPKYHWQEKQN